MYVGMMFIRLAYDTLCSTTESCNVCIIVSALCWSSGSAVHMYSKQCTCSMQYSVPAVQLYSLRCIQNALMYFVRWWYIHICALLDVPPFRRILHYTIPRQVGTYTHTSFFNAQTYVKTAGLYLPRSVFGHGHVYVGFSRCGDPDNVFVFANQK